MHPILRSERFVNEDSEIVNGTSSLSEGRLLLSRKGYCLPFKHNFNMLSINKIIRIWPKNEQVLDCDLWNYLEYALISEYPLSHSDSMVKDELYNKSFVNDFRIVSKRIYLPKNLGFSILNGSTKIRKDILSILRIEKVLENMVCIVMNNPPSTSIDDSFFDCINGLKVDTLMEIFIVPKKSRKYNNKKRENIVALNEFVEETLNNCFADEVLIPYELMDRKEKFPQAYKLLSEYIKYRED
jgi:hypothetical protein